jgi:hypothetical protein
MASWVILHCNLCNGSGVYVSAVTQNRCESYISLRSIVLRCISIVDSPKLGTGSQHGLARVYNGQTHEGMTQSGSSIHRVL